MAASGLLAQYYAVICANLLCLVYGISVGWPSASLPLLRSEETPLPAGPLTLFESSCIGSILCVGGALGTGVYGWLAERYGRKPAILSAAIPGILSWLLIAFGKNFYHLFTSRILTGFAGGCAFVVIPLIVSEVSDINVRGILGSFLILFHNAGIVLGYIFCSYLNYYTVPWIGVAITAVFFVGYLIVPETPEYLIMNGKKEETRVAIKFFKGIKNDNDVEMILRSLENEDKYGNSGAFSFGELCETATKRAFLIGGILMNTVAFTGAFTLTNYYETIFKEAGSNLSPAMSSIVVGTIQTAGVCSASLLIEKAGRKLLILTSAYLSALCLTVLGVYLCVKDKGMDVSSIASLPLICLSALVFIAANGASSVPFVVLGEIFAQNVRGCLISICLIINWMISFILVLVFPYMVEFLKLYGALWVFVGIGITLATILLFIMPETKGLSIDAIVGMLGEHK